MVYKCFDKKCASLVHKATSGGTAKNGNISKKELAEEVHKLIIRKFEKRSSKYAFDEKI